MSRQRGSSQSRMRTETGWPGGADEKREYRIATQAWVDATPRSDRLLELICSGSVVALVSWKPAGVPDLLDDPPSPSPKTWLLHLPDQGDNGGHPIREGYVDELARLKHLHVHEALGEPNAPLPEDIDDRLRFECPCGEHHAVSRAKIRQTVMRLNPRPVKGRARKPPAVALKDVALDRLD